MDWYLWLEVHTFKGLVCMVQLSTNLIKPKKIGTQIANKVKLMIFQIVKNVVSLSLKIRQNTRVSGKEMSGTDMGNKSGQMVLNMRGTMSKG